jgi:hypothetical protein
MAFDPPEEGTPNMGMGSNDLQSSIDKNTAALNSLTTAYQGQSMGNGMSQSPSFSAAAPDARFSSGTFPSMSMPSMGGQMTVLGGAQPATGGGGSGGTPPTLNSMASGAGANGGGPSFGGGTPAATPGPSGGGSGGSGGGGMMGAMASGGGANAGGSSFGAAGAALGAAGGAATAIAGIGQSSMSNMMLYNSTGAQLQNQYGISAQGAQNAIFGSGVNLGMVNAQNPQDAAQAAMTLNQMASGNWGSTQFTQGVAATNQATAAIQGLSATQGAQFAQQLYSPSTSLNMMTSGFGGVTPLQVGSGKAVNMAKFTSSILPRLGIHPTGPNGTYNKQQVAALSNPGSAQNIDLQNAGWSQSMVQDYSSIVGSANNAASSKYAMQHHDSMSSIMGLMNTAQGTNNTKSQRDSAWSQLQSMGMSRSSLNQVQALTQQQTANQQSESGGYNQTLQQGVSYLADMDEKLGQLLTSFSGLASALGGIKGAGGAASIGGGMLGGSLLGGLGGGLAGGLLGKLGGGLLSGGKSLLGGGESLLGDAGSLLGGGAAGGADAAAGGAAAGAGGLAAGLGTGGAALLSMLANSLASKGGSALGSKLGTSGAASHLGGVGKNLTSGVLSGISQIPGLGPTTDLLKSMFGFATGGTVPGFTPGSDNHIVSVSGGEGILTPEATMGIGGSSTIDFLNSKYAGYRGGGSNSSSSGFATGGTVPTSSPSKSSPTSSAMSAQITKMLSVMKSKVGDAYTQQIPERFGPNQFDCSGLIWYAANQSGIGMPGGPSDDAAAIVGPEMEWLGKQKGAQVIKSAQQIQQGDILAFTGADPAPTSFTVDGQAVPAGEFGHIGMATSASQYVSAYDTQDGVALKPIAGDVFNLGVRLGGGAASGTPASGSNSNTNNTPASGGSSSGAVSMASANGGDTNLGLTTDSDSLLFSGSTASGTRPASMTANVNNSGGSGSGNGTPGTAPAGNGVTGIAALAKYLVTAGYSKPAAAGAAGVAGGEGTNANPEITGSGGYGLIGWTPPGGVSSGTPGVIPSQWGNSPLVAEGAVPPWPTGNAAHDMSVQEVAMVKWMTVNGWPPPQNKFPSTSAGALQAALNASATYEKPAVPGSDVHSQDVQTAWDAVSGMDTGGTFIAGERGAEAVTVPNGMAANVMNANQTASLLSGTAAKVASANSLFSPAVQFLMDSTPANLGNPGAGGGGAQINLTFGDINIGGSGGGTAGTSTQFSGTLNPGSDIDTIKQQFQAAVEEAVNNSKLLMAVRTGDTG